MVVVIIGGISSGRTNRNYRMQWVVASNVGIVARRCIIFPEGHVDERETASGEHGDAVLAVVTGFMGIGIDVMFFWFKGKYLFKG